MSDPWPPGVHAHGTADRPRDADRPREPAPSGVGHPSGQHGQCHRRSRPHDAVAAAVATFREVDRGEPRAEMQHDPVEPVVRHQQVGAAAQDEHRWRGRGRRVRRVLAEGRPHRVEVTRSVDLDIERRRAADPVGGQRPQRLVPRGTTPQRLGQGVQVARRHHRGDSSSSSGSLVRSPAPSVRQRSPGRSSIRRLSRSSSHPAA